MKINSEYLVQISDDQNKGCGIVFSYDESLKRALIITAKHCISQSPYKTASKNVLISFQDLSGTQIVFRLDDNIPIFSEDSDLAILIINNIDLPENYQPISIIKLRGSEKNFFMRGYSKLTDHEEIRILSSIKEAESLGNKQFQVEIGDPVTDLYNADILLEGYSGSGICIQVEDDIYACGIISEYEYTLKRFTAIDFDEVNTLLASHELSVEILTIETDKTILQDITTLKLVSQSFLNRVKSKIGTIHLDRSSLKTNLNDSIKKSNLSIVSGKAGNGKSALIKSVLEDCKDDYEIIVLTGEIIDKPRLAEVFNDLKIQTNIEQLLDSPGLKTQKIIFIDSIEKILETKNASTISDFLNLLNTRRDIKLVLGCRQYAVQNLTMRFLSHYESFDLVEIPCITDQELEQIFEAYPSIQQLSQSSSLKNLLKIPFNLDKAVTIKNTDVFKDVDSEKKFRKVFWEYVIENKEKESDRNINIKRGEIFSLIALERIKQMSSYVKVKDQDHTIIRQLLHDNIIQEDPKNQNLYSPSHDIYEDWAVLKFIDEEFNSWSLQNSTNIEDFFTAIGNYSGIRRGFRNWLSEALSSAEYNLKSLISKSLTADKIEQYWKDDILIAILRSDFCKNFLVDNNELLFENSLQLFERILYMLKVGCQVRDERRLNGYIPDGPGWKAILEFIDKNFEQVKERVYSILILIMEWKSKIYLDQDLPEESKTVGNILFKVINHCNETNEFNREITESIVPVLFKLTEVIKEPLQLLMEESLENEKTTLSIKYLYSNIIDKSLQWEYSRSLSRFLPDTILKYAEKKWFFQIREIPSGTTLRPAALSARLPRRKGRRESFGVSNAREFEYSPAGEYQTPISHLLKYSPANTIAFIVRLFNHSTETVRHSDYFNNRTLLDEIGTKEVSYALEDGTIIKQYGNEIIWCMYRGARIATPDLLQSVLMTLEDWMLDLCELATSEMNPEILDLFKERLYLIFDYLIRHSRSVATTGVLISIATAYPKLIGKRILPLLTVREFFKWDLMRFANQERNPIIIADLNNPYAQEKRFKSNDLPHRKQHMESLVLSLSQTELQDEIFAIIDKLHEQYSEEANWKLVLNRIDLRKFEIIGKTENSIIVGPKIDDELIPTVNEYKEEQDQISPFLNSCNWALAKYRNNLSESESYTYNDWVKIRSSILSKPNHMAALYNPHGILAFIGVRDYFDELSDEEKEWCVNRLFFIVESEINRSFDPYNTEPLKGYSSFEVDPSVDSLCLLIHLYANTEVGNKALELCFNYLAYVDPNTPDRKDLLNEIRTYLWNNQPEKGLALARGLIQYSELFNLELFIRHSHLSKKELRKSQKEYQVKMKSILKEILSPSKDFDFQHITIESHSIWYLVDAVLIIPYNTTNSQLQNFVSHCVNIVISNSDDGRYGMDEKIPYNLKEKIEQYYANYLLHQNNTSDQFTMMVSNAIKITSDRIGGEFEFVNRCLNNMVDIVNKETELAQNFWVLWDLLYKEMTETKSFYFKDIFFLHHRYLTLRTDDWPPMKGKKQFYLSKILTSEICMPIVKLIAGPGFNELVPEALPWLAKKVNTENFSEFSSFLEVLVQKIFSIQAIRETIRSNSELRIDFIKLLDTMIDNKSTVAFFVREDFISSK